MQDFPALTQLRQAHDIFHGSLELSDPSTALRITANLLPLFSEENSDIGADWNEFLHMERLA